MSTAQINHATTASTGRHNTVAPRIGSKSRGPSRARRRVWSVVAIAIALVWVFPVYWMLNSSLLPNRTLQSFVPTFFPVGGSFRNFEAAIADGSFFSALGMSVSITLIVVFFCLLFAFLAAIAISRYRFKGRKSFVLAVLLVQMLPAEGLFIAQYQMMSSLGLLNSIVGVSIIYTAAVVPFTIWMLRGFVAGIPAELEEAAMVDGLSRPQAFMRITFPLLAPGLVASGVFAFLQAWNEFTVALVLLQSESSHTLPLWLRGFVQAGATRETDWGQVMAASTLVAIPVIIFFLIVQGRMTSGLVGGAVKG
ncbi:carbohydrate ABC transporter permease [Lysinibacter sp. HNR]|uniref:carbohydrate ABC transporter permease n=1 Tax=Lysinibacter sp. HNR TaxID=3031408 RepID=UPI0024354AAC|nr:carbohydrate ABC transporter permease [Lysinibacter sp. HNR]WGD38016.1 carbohydrate ABC transporter permease [Lysinibacter sp. HNR]